MRSSYRQVTGGAIALTNRKLLQFAYREAV
jgi:hypothetical protein